MPYVDISHVSYGCDAHLFYSVYLVSNKLANLLSSALDRLVMNYIKMCIILRLPSYRCDAHLVYSVYMVSNKLTIAM